MKKILLASAMMTSMLFGHTAIMSCFDNADGTITCEGGFSDGSSASGINFFILENGKKTFSAKMSEDSEVTFKKPSADYEAVFDAGEGHAVHVKGSDITE